MLILFSKLLNLPVIELESQKKIASVFDVVVDPDDGKVLGLIVKVGQILPKEMLVASRDITQLLPTAVLVDNENKISDIDEVIKIKNLYKKNSGLISKKVKTKSGKIIGKVDDFLVFDSTMMLNKIYVRHMLSDRIIPYSAIIKIDKKVIIIKDDFEALSVLEGSEAPAGAEMA